MLDNEEVLQTYVNRIKNSVSISPEIFDKWNIKRGLRNSDGTGVVVGVTAIGDVHGYIIDEGVKTPTEGRLRYRGIDIKDLVAGFQKEKRFGYEETAYLLIFGELPNASLLEEFRQILSKYRDLPGSFIEDMILRQPSSNVMNKLGRTVLSLYSIDPNAEDYSIGNILKQCIRLVARIPILAAYCYQAKRHYYDNKSLFIHNYEPSYSTGENFLHLIRADRKFTPLEAELLDLCLVLHAEHGGGNNSAFTARVVSSAETDTYAAISAAIGSLKGRKHGGANIQVKQMVNEIRENVSDWTNETALRDYLVKIIKKEAGDGTGLVYGIGHAIYTLSDPRAIILKEKARELAEKSGRMDDFILYERIEKLTPGVFKEVKGYENVMSANVDLYSGFVYEMLNIPEELYTPLFAVSRVSGWCAHRIEEILGSQRIIRPAYRSVTKSRAYVPLAERN